jgi:hypothetical protein
VAVDESPRKYKVAGKRMILQYGVKTTADLLVSNASKLNQSPAKASLEPIVHRYYEPTLKAQFVIEETPENKKLYKENAVVLNAGKGGILDEFLKMANPSLKGIQAGARAIYPYDDTEIFEMDMVNDTFVQEFLGPNYTPNMNSMKETYTELAKDLYHAKRLTADLDDINLSKNKPFAYFDKVHVDKLITVGNDNKLQFTAFATDLGSFLFGAPGTLLSEKKYASTSSAAVRTVRPMDKSKPS